MVRVDESRIEAFDLYDSEEFRFVLEYLKKNSFKFSRELRNSKILIAGFSKLYWRASDPVLTTNAGINGESIQGEDILHSGIHHMLTRKFGAKIEHFPMFTLLSEAIASASDFYFTLDYYQRHDANHPRVKSILTPLFERAKGTGRDPLPILSSSMDRKFEAYKESVFELFELMKHLYTLSFRPLSFNEKRLASFNRKTIQMKYFPVLTDFDYPTFILYTRSFCKKSGKSDASKTKECIRLLKKSKSMLEFMTSLAGTTAKP